MSPALQADSLPTELPGKPCVCSAAAAAAAAKSRQSCPTVRPHRRQPTRLPRPCDSPGKNTGVGCHFLLQCMKVKSQSEVAQSCPTLSDPMDCSPPGSSVHGIFQARVLEWGAIAFSGVCSRTQIFSSNNWHINYRSFQFPAQLWSWALVFWLHIWNILGTSWFQTPMADLTMGLHSPYFTDWIKGSVTSIVWAVGSVCPGCRE